MRTLPMLFAAILLAACSQGEDTAQGSDDFAARVAVGEGEPAPQGSVAAADSTVARTSAAPEGADPMELEKLGNIGRVDLGPRDGGCTFSQGGTEMLLVGAPNDAAVQGRGVIRVGGELVNMTAQDGGLDAIYAGPTLTAEGLTVKIVPAAGEGTVRTADLYVAADGKQRKFASGQWACG
ncbi:hypothetical protein [Alteriqipengyuania sp. 357]